MIRYFLIDLPNKTGEGRVGCNRLTGIPFFLKINHRNSKGREDGITVRS